MPTMTIPSANMRRLKKLAADAAAKSPGGRPRSNLRMRPPAPPVPRHEERVAPPAAGARFGARVLVVPTPSAGTAPPGALPVELVRAVVVSAADESGYLEVVYEGASLPGEDPFATVRVPRDQIIASTPPPGVCATSGGVGLKASSSSSPPGAEAHENLEMLAGAAIKFY